MQLSINGTTHDIDVEPETPLLWVIREELGMTGTKYGCGLAQCGACTVLVDGEAVRSCVTPVDSMAGADIVTIEAAAADPVGSKVIDAWIAHQVPQCGYCQSGQVMAAVALLKANPSPSEEDILGSMANLCRCATYNGIVAAVQQAAKA
ncbi:(2Fe-2S)-binding protein [Roseomonas sp. 18066]|uniref:(2Fe-2S)-binding protein n=1 Tax=Roseomonas sp. 18066 TaxID=2681412 RepID=UPI00135A2CD4|nr:(2Fe-2S)-binding protein [Roseomonas sp. 18066]